MVLLALCSPAAFANHPLITEDTQILDKGLRQIEIHGGRARDSQAGVARRTTDVSGVLSYSVAGETELQLELPYMREVTNGAVVEGRGDAALALKWRFLDRTSLSMIVKPELRLPTGRDDLGIGAGRARWALNLAGAYDFGRLETIAHVGYLRNLNRIGERKVLWHRSVALLWSATERLRLVLDFGVDSRPESGARTHERQLAYGLTYALREHVDLGLGIKKGLNAEADDRTLLAGVKFRW